MEQKKLKKTNKERKQKKEKPGKGRREKRVVLTKRTLLRERNKRHKLTFIQQVCSAISLLNT